MRIFILCLLFGIYFPTSGSAQISYLDQKFGDGGIVRDTGTSIFRTQIEGIEVLPDGKIITFVRHFTFTVDSNFHRLSLFKYLPDGKPDPTFGNQGTVEIQPATFYTAANQNLLEATYSRQHMEVLNDGKITVSYISTSADSIYAVISNRLADGSPNPAFGQNGVVKIGDKIVPGEPVANLNAIKRMTNGQYALMYHSLVAGEHYTGFRFIDETGQMLSPNGAILWHDNQFSTIYLNPLALQSDNKIVIGADRLMVSPNSPAGLLIHRFLSDGSVDHDFGYDGTAYFTFGEIFEHIMEIAIQPDGKILVLAWSASDNMLLARLLPNGDLDPDFGIGGKWNYPPILGDHITVGLHLSDNTGYQGEFALVRNKYINGSVPQSPYEAAVIRLKNDGSIDTGFSQDTIVRLPIFETGFRSFFDNAIMLPDRRILCTGTIDFKRFMLAMVLPEAGATPWYRDADGDGFGDENAAFYAVNQPSGYIAVKGDCDDTDPAVSPDAIEICNGKDDNCDGFTDNISAPVLCKTNVSINVPQEGFATITPEDIRQEPSVFPCTGSGAVSSVNPTTLSCTQLGQNAVTLTVTDTWGNTSTCQTTVKLIDQNPPVLACKNEFTIFVNAGELYVVQPEQALNGSFDNCAISSLSIAPNQYTSADIGIHPVVVTAEDASGNTSECHTVVRVETPSSTAEGVAESHKFRLSPNPATNVITIKVPANDPWTGGQVIITGTDGKTIRSLQRNGSSDMVIPVEDLPAGNYRAVLSASGSIIATLPFVKL